MVIISIVAPPDVPFVILTIGFPHLCMYSPRDCMTIVTITRTIRDVLRSPPSPGSSLNGFARNWILHSSWTLFCRRCATASTLLREDHNSRYSRLPKVSWSNRLYFSILGRTQCPLGNRLYLMHPDPDISEWRSTSHLRGWHVFKVLRLQLSLWQYISLAARRGNRFTQTLALQHWDLRCEAFMSTKSRAVALLLYSKKSAPRSRSFDLIDVWLYALHMSPLPLFTHIKLNSVWNQLP